ncbi:MAG: hypothetical protein ACI4VR_01740 [Bacilli bacterium]
MKRVLLLISLLMLFFTIYLTMDTYALFESNKNYDVSSDIAKFVIKVNGSEAKTEEFVVDSIAYYENEYVIDNKIAPLVDGYFDIVIDAEDVEVSLRYDIEFDFSSLSIPGLVISSITELGGNTLVLTDKDTYSGVITLADMDSSTVNTVRVSISWQNDEANNEVDSSWGMVANKVISIPVNVKLTQYLGEELSVYVE